MPIKVLMPALSPTMTEGNLAKWIKKEGDLVQSGDVIAEIETDKATMEVEAVDEGKLAKIIIAEGTEGVAVNTPIAVLLEEDEDESALEGFSLEADVAQPAQQAAAPQPAAAPAASNVVTMAQSTAAPIMARAAGERVYISPIARRMAMQEGLDVSRVAGTGPRGRIIKQDIENIIRGVFGNKQPAAATPAAKPEPSGPDAKELADMLGMAYEETKNDNVRKTIAKRLQESKQTVPHFYLTVECQIDNLLAVRKQQNDAANGEYKLSVNDFVVKAVANALRDFPKANVAWTDKATLQYKDVDVSIAVSTDSGLITPIVKQTDTKDLPTLSAEIKGLATRARENKLKPQEFQGGTFTVSNLGMFGVDEFSAIINPPQSCILAVGAGKQKPYVDGGEVKVGTFMKVTLSTDHRTVDGAVGAEYLQVFKKYIEEPETLLS